MDRLELIECKNNEWIERRERYIFSEDSQRTTGNYDTVLHWRCNTYRRQLRERIRIPGDRGGYPNDSVRSRFQHYWNYIEQFRVTLWFQTVHRDPVLFPCNHALHSNESGEYKFHILWNTESLLFETRKLGNWEVIYTFLKINKFITRRELST